MLNAISLRNVSKTYRNYSNGWQRLAAVIYRKTNIQAIHALYPIDLQIPHGQVVGIIGNNGAGKSTLLKIVAGTLMPDVQGECITNGRVAALLELGSGFHLEMTGRQNIYLSATIIGLNKTEIEHLYPYIIEFAGIGEFIDLPVKTYSSGMFMRLAFAIATCTNPDILIIDEALSVGDGSFARKSFERIMQFRQQRKTILFCSHSMYQVEKICDRVLWLDNGQLRLDGTAAQVLPAYNEFLNSEPSKQPELVDIDDSRKLAYITQVIAKINNIAVSNPVLQTGQNDFSIEISFNYAEHLPQPTLGVAIWRKDGLLVSSASTHNDGYNMRNCQAGQGKISIYFKQLNLLKGNYTIHVSIGCENALHLYDQIVTAVDFSVEQTGVEQGVITLAHEWRE
jgi:lipopolysaccharide transport system ATP-binding protein